MVLKSGGAVRLPGVSLAATDGLITSDRYAKTMPTTRTSAAPPEAKPMISADGPPSAVVVEEVGEEGCGGGKGGGGIDGGGGVGEGGGGVGGDGGMGKA